MRAMLQPWLLVVPVRECGVFDFTRAGLPGGFAIPAGIVDRRESHDVSGAGLIVRTRVYEPLT